MIGPLADPRSHCGDPADAFDVVSVFDGGGHFAVMDAPDLLIGDLRTFFRHFR